MIFFGHGFQLVVDVAHAPRPLTLSKARFTNIRKQLRFHASRGFRTTITQIITAINLWQVRSDASTDALAMQK